MGDSAAFKVGGPVAIIVRILELWPHMEV